MNIFKNNSKISMIWNKNYINILRIEPEVPK